MSTVRFRDDTASREGGSARMDLTTSSSVGGAAGGSARSGAPFVSKMKVMSCSETGRESASRRWMRTRFCWEASASSFSCAAPSANSTLRASTLARSAPSCSSTPSSISPSAWSVHRSQYCSSADGRQPSIFS